jgi:hypothetical protein
MDANSVEIHSIIDKFCKVLHPPTELLPEFLSYPLHFLGLNPVCFGQKITGKLFSRILILQMYLYRRLFCYRCRYKNSQSVWRALNPAAWAGE